uniref:Uncharacterized protein n=1 Tax=Anguilla anguilla TaxID=7936 RepID=A0A0E9WS48_ANGAN
MFFVLLHCIPSCNLFFGTSRPRLSKVMDLCTFGPFYPCFMFCVS